MHEHVMGNRTRWRRGRNLAVAEQHSAAVVTLQLDSSGPGRDRLRTGAAHSQGIGLRLSRCKDVAGQVVAIICGGDGLRQVQRPARDVPPVATDCNVGAGLDRNAVGVAPPESGHAQIGFQRRQRKCDGFLNGGNAFSRFVGTAALRVQRYAADDQKQADSHRDQ